MNCLFSFLFSTNVSHAQFSSLSPPPSSCSFSIYTPSTTTVDRTAALRLPYPIQYYIITIQSSIFPKRKKQNEVESSSQPSPLSSPPEMQKKNKKQNIPEPWINYLHLPCKVIKLFNSNNLIQTFPLLSSLSFSIPFFPFLSTYYTTLHT